MPIIGQERILEHLNKLVEEDKLPKMIIFAGERGQGRTTIAKHIARQVGDIYEPEKLRVDDIRTMVDDAQSLSRPRVYILKNADDMTMQAQNALLKFAEEPTNNSYIMLGIEHENNILPTIKSRGSIYQMEQYTRSQLEQVTDDTMLLDIFTNPGQIKRAQQVDISKLQSTAEKVISNISRVSAANVFNIAKHFEEFDLDLVITMLLYKYAEKMKSGSSAVLDQIKVIYKYKRQFRNKSINKSNALEIMFVELREKSVK